MVQYPPFPRWLVPTNSDLGTFLKHRLRERLCRMVF